MSTPSTQIVRVAAVAFAVHALLLLVGVFGFEAAFSNGHDSDRFWPSRLRLWCSWVESVPAPRRHGGGLTGSAPGTSEPNTIV